MGLSITEVSLKGFRNYETFSFNEVGALTIFVGQNAKGKTNIIEGIQILTAQSSFRNPTSQQLVRWGSEQARLDCMVEGDGRSLDFCASIDSTRRRYELNGKPKKIQSMKGILPSVAFTPDDLRLVKGSHDAKRQAIDALGSQITPNYHTVRKDYEKLIKHKNRLLKEDGARAYLDAVDETLLTVGTQLFIYRQSLFKRIASHIAQGYRQITGGRESASATYRPSWLDDSDSEAGESLQYSKEEARVEMERALAEHRPEEIARKRAVIGPHADKVEFFIEGRNARTFGSQGQQRSVVLSLKLAEIEVLKETAGKPPVLLLDDVMSELDEQRRNLFVNSIREGVQTFITTTNLQYFDEELVAKAETINLNEDFENDRITVKR